MAPHDAEDEGYLAEAITFQATVYKVQTLATDLGVRVTFDLPEDAIPQMAMLAEAKRQGIYLDVSCKAHLDGLDLDNGTKRRGRKSTTG